MNSTHSVCVFIFAKLPFCAGLMQFARCARECVSGFERRAIFGKGEVNGLEDAPKSEIEQNPACEKSAALVISKNESRACVALNSRRKLPLLHG
jgi:hypothetical protein